MKATPRFREVRRLCGELSFTEAPPKRYALSGLTRVSESESLDLVAGATVDSVKPVDELVDALYSEHAKTLDLDDGLFINAVRKWAGEECIAALSDRLDQENMEPYIDALARVFRIQFQAAAVDRLGPDSHNIRVLRALQRGAVPCGWDTRHERPAVWVPGLHEEEE